MNYMFAELFLLGLTLSGFDTIRYEDVKWIQLGPYILRLLKFLKPVKILPKKM